MYCSSSNLGSSRAMHASEAWDASNICLTKMRSVPLIRFLPKMSPSSSTSTGSQIATWTRSLTWTCRELASIFIHRRRERCSSDYTSVSHWTRLSTIFFPHRQSQLSDLTIRLHITTSLKSISQKRWLYHPIFKQSTNSKQSHVTSSTSVISNS